MTGPSLPGPDGPATHYELFAGLRGAGVRYLLTGAAALTLHGVPRLTPDIDLVIDPDPANIGRIERLLAAWGYGEAGPPGSLGSGTAIRRFRHPGAPLAEVDAVLPAAAEYGRLTTGRKTIAFVDVEVPLVGAADLREHKVRASTPEDREDAESLEVLAAILAGGSGSADDTRREQIRKFSRWSVAARCDWLLAAARLRQGLSPEAKPMTRGLIRRRSWYGR